MARAPARIVPHRPRTARARAEPPGFLPSRARRRGRCILAILRKPRGTRVNLDLQATAMNEASEIPAIVHNLEARRFEAQVGTGLARVDYQRVGDTLHLVHTEVPPEAAGKGIAASLVEAALDFAAGNRLKVVPMCDYVRKYMRTHPETHELLAGGAHL
jgi:hypothetical protein